MNTTSLYNKVLALSVSVFAIAFLIHIHNCENKNNIISL